MFIALRTANFMERAILPNTRCAVVETANLLYVGYLVMSNRRNKQTRCTVLYLFVVDPVCFVLNGNCQESQLNYYTLSNPLHVKIFECKHRIKVIMRRMLYETYSENKSIAQFHVC